MKEIEPSTSSQDTGLDTVYKSALKMGRDDLPDIGEWYYVSTESFLEGKVSGARGLFPEIFAGDTGTKPEQTYGYTFRFEGDKGTIERCLDDDDDDDDNDDEEGVPETLKALATAIPREILVCVRHVGSNYVRAVTSSIGYKCEETDELYTNYKFEDWHRAVIRKVDDPSTVFVADMHLLQARMTEKVNLLKEATTALNLNESVGDSDISSFLPSLTRVDPDEYSKKLKELKDEVMPRIQNEIKEISCGIAVCSYKLSLSMRVESDRMNKAVHNADARIFNIKLYAGLQEGVRLIRDGEPAPIDTVVHIRQALMYMDEECLMNYEFGGMDIEDLSDFDAWIAKPENCDRLLPEQRCVVAFQVRRHSKAYEVKNMNDALRVAELHRANEWTYLLFRNGDKMYRMAPDIDFKPRLIPLRGELSDEFVETHSEGGWHGNPEKIVKEKITPDHIDYDEHVEKRTKEIMHYNRMVVLLQGVLDRSDIFSPHHPFTVTDNGAHGKYYKVIRDEEDSVSGKQPTPVEEYWKEKNKLLKRGDIIAHFGESEREKEDRGYREDRFGNTIRSRRPYGTNPEPNPVEIDRISRDRSKVSFSWPYGTRTGYKYKTWGEWGEWPVNKRLRETYLMEQVINLRAYRLGDYKAYLSTRESKASYGKWASKMLFAENWNRKRVFDDILSKLDPEENGVEFTDVALNAIIKHASGVEDSDVSKFVMEGLVKYGWTLREEDNIWCKKDLQGIYTQFLKEAIYQDGRYYRLSLKSIENMLRKITGVRDAATLKYVMKRLRKDGWIEVVDVPGREVWKSSNLDSKTVCHYG